MSKQVPRANHTNRWLLAVVVGFVVYGLSQPYLNAWFGINLPSLAQFAEETGGEDPQVASRTDAAERDSEPVASDAGQTGQKTEADQTRKVDEKTSVEGDKQPPGEQAAVDPLTEYLKETPPGSENYLSPQGLRYTRGSQEGHRLKHLERHLADQPNRPGKHGVFTGDMLQVLKWLDDAYTRGKRKAKGTRQRTEDGRTVYEVPFDEELGYVGGQVGRREGNPTCKKIRLVVEGNRVITAFPF